MNEYTTSCANTRLRVLFTEMSQLRKGLTFGTRIAVVALFELQP